ncbi:MAG TPA: lipoyl(octanoyl) transferase LipB [Phycisphaerae bacterium]|nr:lipoyl(octanoyl) transferase LipB [Phycisphaerae bacterium]
MQNIACVDLGRRSYAWTLDLQRRLVRRVQADGDAGFLLVLEHDPPAITLGRRGRPEHVLASQRALAAEGVELHRSARGGQATYHGPGQLVGYPILSLRSLRLGVRQYIRRIEGALIRTLTRFGIEAGRADGRPGVWVGRHKVASIGVAVERGVCCHGFALNVSTNLRHFDLIVPCGLAPGTITSVSALTGSNVSVNDVKPVLIESFAEVLSLPVWRASLGEIESPAEAAAHV